MVTGIADKFAVDIVVQLGTTNVSFKNNKITYFDFKPKSEIIDLIEKADVIISQGGLGGILDVLEIGKPLVVVPRLVKLGESIDDQSEITTYFQKKGFLKRANNSNELEQIMKDIFSKKITFERYEIRDKIPIYSIINSFLNDTKC